MLTILVIAIGGIALGFYLWDVLDADSYCMNALDCESEYHNAVSKQETKQR